MDKKRRLLAIIIVAVLILAMAIPSFYMLVYYAFV